MRCLFQIEVSVGVGLVRGGGVMLLHLENICIIHDSEGASESSIVIMYVCVIHIVYLS